VKGLLIPDSSKKWGMEWRALGDSAWLFEAVGEDSPRRLDLVLKLVRLLNRERIPQVVDVVSSFASVAVYFDPADGARVLAWLSALDPQEADGADEAGRTVEIPVVYGDLEEVTRAVGRTRDEVVRLHSAADYTVAALGFAPGFPYLTGLPPELALPRLATPRKVEAGAVAIAGGQAGIYPCASQGGWHVLGKTSAEMFRPEAEPPTLLRPGDRVRFVPVEETQPARKSPPEWMVADGGLEIIEPGPMTSVQDLGRTGFRHLGIALGGAADPISQRVANRLIGNPDGAAVLECCLRGPVLKFHQSSRMAFVGWADLRAGSVIEVKAGGEIDLRGRMRSVRGYVAIAGGIDVPHVIGSRATDLRSGFGGFRGRALMAGDRLPIGPPHDGPKPGRWRVGWPEAAGPGRMIELRFLPGMQMEWFSTRAQRRFRSTEFAVSTMSDRMGVRLDGAALDLADLREMVSQPVAPGSVQVPPNGQPIVLMPECQTIGGYPQIGHVISADLPELARAWPGTPIRFREVSLDEARHAWQQQEQDIAFLQAGLDFRR
jgi:KipI family sensor histidine kinase inhibitor